MMGIETDVAEGVNSAGISRCDTNGREGAILAEGSGIGFGFSCFGC
jgi:hypothetical protein